MVSKMFNNFMERTNRHISNVEKVFLYLFDTNKKTSEYLEDMGIDRESLVEHIYTHDDSKFSIEEMMGYILMTEKYNRKVGYRFTEDDQRTMDKAWEHHKKVNSHHPEYFEDVSLMKQIDVVDMCCDWGAMSLEFDNSLVDFKEEKAYPKYNFTDDQKALVDFLCEEIEEGRVNGSI